MSMDPRTAYWTAVGVGFLCLWAVVAVLGNVVIRRRERRDAVRGFEVLPPGGEMDENTPDSP